MKFVQYQDCKSPHQLPLARELLRRLGLDNFRYVYRDADQAERAELGWNMGGADEPWQLHIGTNPEETHELIENAEVLLTGMREIDLFERRSAKGLKTFYQTERWFKPIDMAGCTLPGWLRLLHPRYMHMALRFRWLVTSSDKFKVLPIGVHSYRDMRFLGVPESQMALWGYFVEPSERTQREPVVHEHECRVLWVGRMLKLKRVDTIIKAFGKVVQSSQCGKDMRLLLVGNGPGRKRLELLAKSLPVSFMDSVPINEVRELMRRHDVYVFSSDGHDGWGAVVSEALEEGMIVLGTRETGASATMLPSERLFSVGDVDALADLLKRAADGEMVATGIGDWSVDKAAKRVLSMSGLD